MNRVLVSAEGQTEETFVREVLRRHLWDFNVELQPVVITTHRVKQGRKFKGGVLSYPQTRNEIGRLLGDTSAVAVTTLYDLYHLPTDFPGQSARPSGSGRNKALHLEAAFQKDIDSPRFRPHLQVHEFEAFLFVDPVRTATFFTEINIAKEIQRIRREFPTPEDINDNPQTAPSKRIIELYPKYEKPLYGTLAVLEIGLEPIRAECPHFDSWLTWLESLG
ncbi:MAG: hypothetical protein DPW18_20665 [Chloroflexi bacterium]|nr:MAG: DUF4276 family protein [Chloroflexota bacterium]MCE7861560.1 DUF4276 family protein [Chloroflexi bacterium CFX2]MCK6566257.1 DUF4276 family protein [Anaerolineales bacterium]MBL1171121.1 DUF4276 family protein [Chloroflexota bacterium]MCQ3939432.1 hypothetical protein [Chloroflexota bacterium]